MKNEMEIFSLVSGFGSGVVATIAVVYGYAKSIGVLSGDYSKLEGDVKAAIGNISLEEVGRIFVESECRLADDGTFSLKDAEIIGIMVLEAAKSK